MPRIPDIATVCKSKNAGPFELTIDVVFGSRELYDRVQATGVLNAALFARLYGMSEDQVLFTPYPAGNAFKATIPRRIPVRRRRRHRRLRRAAARAAARRRDPASSRRDPAEGVIPS